MSTRQRNQPATAADPHLHNGNGNGKHPPEPHLRPSHREELKRSGISDEVILARGYWSAERQSELIRLGFRDWQASAPSLVIPIKSVSGETVNYQHKPDRPRIKGDKSIKYETMAGSRLSLDIPAGLSSQLRDPSVALVWTEGAKKVDAAMSQGIPCIGLFGVYGFLGTNDLGGKTVLDDFDDIALNDRLNYLAFDSDAWRKWEVYRALERHRAALVRRGAIVHIIRLPDAPDGSKQGLDDYLCPKGQPLRGWPDLMALVTEELPLAPKRAISIRTAGDYLDDVPSPGLVIPRPYFLKPDATGQTVPTEGDDEDDQQIIAYSPIVITGVLKDTDEGIETFRLAYRRPSGWRTINAERGVILDTRKINELASHGFPVASDNAKDLVKYLHRLEAANQEKIPCARVSSHLGWQGPKGSLGFLWGRTLILPTGDAAPVVIDDLPPEEWSEKLVSFRGAAAGDEQIAGGLHASGSFDEWRKAVAVLVNYPRALLGLYTSLVPPLLEILDCPNFIVDWSNRTSTGKTTTARVAASPWGCPDEHAPESALWMWDATRVFIERAAAVLSGIPLILDDTKRARDPKMVADILYTVASGKDRGRGNLKGVDRTQTWRTVMLSTGEAPATSFSQDGGTRTRCLSVRGMPFGKDDSATRRVVDSLNASLITHYGHAGPAFVRYLLQNRSEWDTYRAEYQQLVETYAAKAPTVEGGRLARYAAAIDLAAALAHAALDLPWDYSDPLDGLWEGIAGEGADAAGELRALRDVISWANSHQESFVGRAPLDRDGDPKPPPGGRWSGRWDAGSDWKFIGFYETVLRVVLSDLGYHPDAVLPGWKERRWIAAEGSTRYTQKVRVRGIDPAPRLVVIGRSAVVKADADVDAGMDVNADADVAADADADAEA